MQREESIQSTQADRSAAAQPAAHSAKADQPIVPAADCNADSGFDSILEAWAREPERWDGLE